MRAAGFDAAVRPTLSEFLATQRVLTAEQLLQDVADALRRALAVLALFAAVA